VQADHPVDQIVERPVGGLPHQWIPPNRAFGVAGIDEQDPVAFLDDRSAVGMVERAPGGGIVGVVADRHRRRGSRAQPGDELVQVTQPLDGVAVISEGLPVAAEKGADAVDDSGFTGAVIGAAVGPQVGVAGVGYLWVTVEGGQSGQNVVAAGVGAAGDLRATVVDQCRESVGARVEPGAVVVALACRVLDMLLVGGVLEAAELAWADFAGAGKAAQCGVGVRLGDAVTQMSEVAGAETDAVGMPR
jgi:hypothetical protein